MNSIIIVEEERLPSIMLKKPTTESMTKNDPLHSSTTTTTDRSVVGLSKHPSIRLPLITKQTTSIDHKIPIPIIPSSSDSDSQKIHQRTHLDQRIIIDPKKNFLESIPPPHRQGNQAWKVDKRQPTPYPKTNHHQQDYFDSQEDDDDLQDADQDQEKNQD